LAKLHKIEEMKARGEDIDPEWLASSGKKSKRGKNRGDGKGEGRTWESDSHSSGPRPEKEQQLMERVFPAPEKPKSSRGRRGGVNRSKGGSNKGGKGQGR